MTFDPLTGQQKLDRYGGQDTLFSLYAMDDFKITPRLLVINGSVRDHRILLKVRADFYNVMNHTNLTGVTSDLNSALFGRSTGNYQPRTIQLGARVEF